MRAGAIKESRLAPDSPELATSLLNLRMIQRRTGPAVESKKTLNGQGYLMIDTTP